MRHTGDYILECWPLVSSCVKTRVHNTETGKKYKRLKLSIKIVYDVHALRIVKNCLDALVRNIVFVINNFLKNFTRMFNRSKIFSFALSFLLIWFFVDLVLRVIYFDINERFTL